MDDDDDDEAVLLAATVATATTLLHYAEMRASIQPYHTSILTGEKWLGELVSSTNLHRFYEQLGMALPVFTTLVTELEDLRLIGESKFMTTHEQVAIFLYTAVTNCSNRKVGERFQRSGDTISR
jgi:hypothetical protein